MKNKSQDGLSPLTIFNRFVFLKSSVAFLGGFSLLSSGLVLTQQQAIATDVLVIPETSAPASPPPATQAPVITPKAAPQVAPVRSSFVKPVAPLKPRTIKIEPKPTTSKPINYAAPKVQLSAPKISVPEVKRTSSPIIPQVPINNGNFSNGVDTSKNSYIDTTQYNASPKTYSAPAAVVLTDRSTGCQTVAQNGQLSGCGVSARRQTPQQTTAFSRKERSPQALPPRNLTVARNLTGIKQSNSATSSSRNLMMANQTKMARIAQPVYSNQTGQPAVHPINSRPQRISDSQVVSLQPIEMNGLKIALAPVPRYNRAASLGSEVAPKTGRTDLIFPVAIPARISSAFGWRVHPIAGSARMHEGTDIAAPIGTPVLAAYAGLVAFADWSGGYGQMVILRHLDGNQESRYAHLSEIFVQPGQQVEQGAVIGQVGSTGFSTGPHLHFEWRHLTEQGWVAVDAGVHLEYALDNLIQSMPVAKTTTNNEG